MNVLTPAVARNTPITAAFSSSSPSPHWSPQPLLQNLSKKLKPNDIESGIKFALMTGNWGLKIRSPCRFQGPTRHGIPDLVKSGVSEVVKSRCDY